MNLDLIRQAGGIIRYHTEPSIRLQSVGEHSWNVAVLILHLHPGASRDVIIQALLHDVPEVITGDIPAPAKWASKDLDNALDKLEFEAADKIGLPRFNLTAFEQRLLRFCDGAELIMRCLQETRMGNSYALSMIDRVLPRLTVDAVNVSFPAVEFCLFLTKEVDDVRKTK